MGFDFGIPGLYFGIMVLFFDTLETASLVSALVRFIRIVLSERSIILSRDLCTLFSHLDLVESHLGIFVFNGPSFSHLS